MATHGIGIDGLEPDSLAQDILGDGSLAADLELHYGYLWRSPDGDLRLYLSLCFDDYIEIVDPAAVVRWEKDPEVRGTTMWLRSTGIRHVPPVEATPGEVAIGDDLATALSLSLGGVISPCKKPNTGKRCEPFFLTRLPE